MKIAIGKTYKDGNGRSWTIDAKISDTLHLAHHVNPTGVYHSGIFHTDGKRYLDVTATAHINPLLHLKPLTEKKTVYCFIIGTGDDTETKRRFGSVLVFNTLAEAEVSKGRNGRAIGTLTWEEEVE